MTPHETRAARHRFAHSPKRTRTQWAPRSEHSERSERPTLPTIPKKSPAHDTRRQKQNPSRNSPSTSLRNAERRNRNGLTVERRRGRKIDLRTGHVAPIKTFAEKLHVHGVRCARRNR